MLRACAVRGDATAAKLWFAVLTKKGHTASTITYNCMATTFIQAGLVLPAMEWLVAMLKEGCQADAAGALEGKLFCLCR